MRKTREATEVFFGAPHDEALLSFEKREFQILTELPGKPFKHKEEADHHLIWNLLNELYKRRCQLKQSCSLRTVRRRADNERNTWAAKVNKKREYIARLINQRPTATIADICRISGCWFKTVKKVKEDLLFQERPSFFTYNNMKPQCQMESMTTIVENVQGTYSTISDIKRKMPSFSKKLIARHLRRTGLRWLQLPKRRKHPKEERHPSRQVFEVISHLVQGMNSPSVTVLYVDEVHFPLVQTSTHHWTTKDRCEDLVYNRRAVDETKLSAIVMCSLEGFVAAQVYRHDITLDDFLFFLQSCMMRNKPGQQVTVLADNATWHTSPVVTTSKAGKFMFFNVRGLFQSNAIENAFSFVRSEFRKRAVVQSIEEEARLLLEIFFQPKNQKRFLGIHRNHLRSLMKLLVKYSPKLQNLQAVPEY